MLQRIQSVWMLLAVVCAALTFRFSFFSGNKVIGANGHLFNSVTASSSATLLIVTVLVLAGTLINIFNYKARRKQIWIMIALIVLSLVNILLYYMASKNFIEGTYDLTALLALAIPVFLILAVRGIVRDQRLVKSADRLR